MVFRLVVMDTKIFKETGTRQSELNFMSTVIDNSICHKKSVAGNLSKKVDGIQTSNLTNYKFSELPISSNNFLMMR